MAQAELTSAFVPSAAERLDGAVDDGGAHCTIASSLAISFASRVVILCVDGIIAQPSALRHTGLVHFFQARSGARPTCRCAQEPLRRSRRNRTSQASPEDLIRVGNPGDRLHERPIFQRVCVSLRRQRSWAQGSYRQDINTVLAAMSNARFSNNDRKRRRRIVLEDRCNLFKIGCGLIGIIGVQLDFKGEFAQKRRNSQERGADLAIRPQADACFSGLCRHQRERKCSRRYIKGMS